MSANPDEPAPQCTDAFLSASFAGPIASVVRRPSPYQTSFPLEEIDVAFADGTSLALLLKTVGWDSLAEPIRRVKPALLHDPQREIAVYRRLLPHAPPGPARCYAAGRDWLLLERVAGRELYRVGDAESWHAAARWLASFHAQLAGTPPLPFLLDYNADFYRQWPPRALACARAPQRTKVEWLAAKYEPLVERLLSLPTTLLHGEFYASNVLVQGPRVCPVDWEMAAVGPGFIDLAALTAGQWSEAERTAMVEAYGAVDPFALGCCRLHLAMQWLGWSPAWEPPKEHARDWLSEAITVAERLTC